MAVVWALIIVIVAGAAGGFVNVFIGDSGLHLPHTDNATQTFQPGFLATVLIGALAALGSWGMTKAIVLSGAAPTASFSTADIANALLIGFGGAKWFKSETEKDVLQRAAAVAASKQPDPTAAATIATASPHEALVAAMNMR
jgi:hypothetical protein